MLKIFLWLRYLRKKKIVFLSIIAVGLSVALLIVVSSLFNGFINAFERSAVDTLGDVVIAPPKNFSKYPELIEQLKKIKQVEAATPALSAPGLLHIGTGNVVAVEVWGIDAASRATVSGFDRFLLRQKGFKEDASFAVAGSPDKIGGFLGIGLISEPNEITDEYDFDKAKEIIGQQVVLTTGAVTEVKGDSEKPQFRRRTAAFTVADVVFSGLYEADKTFIYLPIKELQKIIYPDQKGSIAQQIQIKLADGANTDTVLAQIRVRGRCSQSVSWDGIQV